MNYRQPRHPLNLPNKILIVRNDRLGDTLLALPVISLLKHSLPGSKLFFVCAPATSTLIRCVDGVDGVVEADDRNLNHVREIKALGADCAICLRATATNALALFRAGIPVRIGTARRWYSALFNRRVNLSRRKSGAHEADLNLVLLKPLGIEGKGLFPAVHLPLTVFDGVQHIRSAYGIMPDQQLALLHPGSGGSARNWPPQSFAKLAGLLKTSGSTVAVTGTAAESGLCEQVAGVDHINLAGKTDLLTLAALIQTSSILVASSTGPLHLAVALGKPVVGLYPPVANCLPERWGPYNHPEYAMIPDLPICKRCTPGNFSSCCCMEQISPEGVFRKASNILAGIGGAN